MIDWLTLIVPLVHDPLPTGLVCSLNANGELEWATHKKSVVEGSYSATVQCKSNGAVSGKASHLYISGNPAKYLQGHNIFGTDDILRLGYRFIRQVLASLSIQALPYELARIKAGGYEVKRIDINRMYHLGDNGDVERALTSLSAVSGTKYRPVHYQKGTCYFNKGSRRYSFVAYNKLAEMTRRNKTAAINLSDNDVALLKKAAQGCLRFELKLQSLELTDKRIKTAKAIFQYGVDKLFNEYLGKIDMASSYRIAHDIEQHLPKRLKTTYLLWKSGENLRDVLPERTFYRHRRELKGFGVDIASVSREPVNNVVYKVEILQAHQFEAPAYIHHLLAA